MPNKDVLEHFGIKGMRWGVRRSEKQLHSVSDDHATASASRAKAKGGGGPKALSNQEIQQVINRMNLERQYKDMNAHWVNKGGRIVLEALTGIGKTQMVRVGNDLASTQIKSQMDKAASIARTRKS